MRNFKDIDITNFFFNGKWLSEFEGVVASGGGGIENFSMLPNIEKQTSQVLEKDGEIFLGARYEPRTFSLDVWFKNVNRLRDITSWLGVLEPKEFYFKNDSVKLFCMIDGGFDWKKYMMNNGTVTLKFIAYDPYYYEIYPKKQIIKNINGTLDIRLFNDSNVKSFPIIEVKNKIGDLRIECNSRVLIVKENQNYIKIDNFISDIFNEYNESIINKMVSGVDYGFIYFIPEINKIKITGNLSEIIFNLNSRWI